MTLPLPATQVVTGEVYACALLKDATVHCWGSTEFGSLGEGPVAVGTRPPTEVAGLTGVTRLESAYGRATCALTTANELWCWGQDSIDMVGGPAAGRTTLFLTSETTHATPIQVDPFP